MQELIDRALAEDLGEGDLTSAAVVPDDAAAKAQIEQKAEGVIAGLRVAEAVFRRLDPALRWHPHVAEGTWREGGLVAEVAGQARPILGTQTQSSRSAQCFGSWGGFGEGLRAAKMLAKTRMTANFANSAGCTVRSLRSIQRRAPLISVPTSLTATKPRIVRK